MANRIVSEEEFNEEQADIKAEREAIKQASLAKSGAIYEGKKDAWAGVILSTKQARELRQIRREYEEKMKELEQET
jgi:predicted DNA-binding transcriptional regulator